MSILLFNSVANESLPIFLGSLVPNYVAVLMSVTLVLICGEVTVTALPEYLECIHADIINCHK